MGFINSLERMLENVEVKNVGPSISSLDDEQLLRLRDSLYVIVENVIDDFLKEYE